MTTPEEIKEDIFTAAKLYLPRVTDETPQEKKVTALEDHAYLAARWRARLEQHRTYLEEALHTFRVQWDDLQGWEVNLNGKRSKDWTQADITEAKRKVRPDLYREISNGKHLVHLLNRQIRRIELDEQRGSRLYTFVTGN